MLRASLQWLACALTFVLAANVANSAGVYDDPAGEFRTPLPDGWTVERATMSKEVCEGTATDIRSGRDPITQLNVRTCAVDLDPASLRESYYKSNPRARAQDEEVAAELRGANAAMTQQLQGLSEQLEAEKRALRQQIEDPRTTSQGRQTAQAKLQKTEAMLKEAAEMQGQFSSLPRGLPAPGDPAYSAYATRVRGRLLESGSRPFFTGCMNALSEAGRLEASGKVNRTTALGRDALRSDFVFYPKKDGKPRKGFMVYLQGNRTSYFFAAMGDEHEYPAVRHMFEATEILR